MSDDGALALAGSGIGRRRPTRTYIDIERIYFLKREIVALRGAQLTLYQLRCSD